MCIGGGYRGPAVDPEAEAEEERRKQSALSEKRERKQEVLDASVEATSKGSGRRSLITGSGGGMGYFNEYNR
jgi:hypothetical protein